MLRCVLCLLLLSLPLSAWAEAETITVNGTERRYLLHVPARLGKGKVPLVVVYHGGGAPPQRQGFGFRDLADREGFIMVQPEGINKHWNDGRDIARTGADDVGFTAVLLDHLLKRYPIDPARVYATGVSNGGMMTHRVGHDLSERFAAIAPMIGGIPEVWAGSFAPARPLSVLIIQGDRDPMVPYAGGEIIVGRHRRGRIISTAQAVKLWGGHNGCARIPSVTAVPNLDPTDGCTAVRAVYPRGREGTEVVLYTIKGGGHTWPGGPQFLPPHVIGRVCRDFRATNVIWEFFSRHTRDKRPGPAGTRVPSEGTHGTL